MTEIQITPTWQDVKPSGFYVYIHRRATDGSVFYVGKGSLDRAWHKSRYARQRGWWLNIARKNGVIVEIAQDEMLEKDAFLLEMWLIAKFKRGGVKLCNLTDGGEGPSGKVMSEETKQLIRESKIGELNHMYGKVHTEVTRAKMCKSRVGKKPALGMRHTEQTKRNASIRVSGDKNPMANEKEYEFWHKDYGRVVATTAYMRGTYGIVGIYRIISGKSLKCSGWRMYARKDEKGHDFSKNCKKVKVSTSSGEVYDTMSDAAREMVKLGYEKATQSAIWYACKTQGRVAFGREWFRIE